MFRAYRIFNEDGKTASRFVELTLDELDPGDVVIRTAYSSVNYKDALAAMGAGKIIRRFPCVGGGGRGRCGGIVAGCAFQAGR